MSVKQSPLVRAGFNSNQEGGRVRIQGVYVLWYSVSEAPEEEGQESRERGPKWSSACDWHHHFQSSWSLTLHPCIQLVTKTC